MIIKNITYAALLMWLGVMAGELNASTTYIYKGPTYEGANGIGGDNYTPPCPAGVSCINYLPGMRITGQFTVETPLTPNTSYYPYFNQINYTSANISDGVNNINPSNGSMVLWGSTDEAGNFQSSTGMFSGLQWQNSSYYNLIQAGPADTADNALFCTERNNPDGSCSMTELSNATSHASVNNSGVWVISQGLAQAALTIVMPTSIQTDQPVELSTTGGSGSGYVYYMAQPSNADVQTAVGTAEVKSDLTCEVSGNILMVSGGPGLCRVTATKLADETYAPLSVASNIEVTTEPTPAPSLSEWAQLTLISLVMLSMLIARRRSTR